MPQQGALSPLSQLSVPLAGLDHWGVLLPGVGLKLVGVLGRYSPMEVARCWSPDAEVVDAGVVCAGTSHAGGPCLRLLQETVRQHAGMRKG